MYYNLGAIIFAQGNKKEAKTYWLKYLQINPTGIFSQMIKDQLEMKILSKKEKLPMNHLDPKPVDPGSSFNNITVAKLSQYNPTPFNFELNKFVLFKDNNNRGDHVLIKDYSVILVENTSNFQIDPYFYQQSLKKFHHIDGVETIVWKKIAMDLKNSKVIKVIHF